MFLVGCAQVEYQCDGFLEKNKDTVNEEQINVLKTSKVTTFVFHLLVTAGLQCHDHFRVKQSSMFLCQWEK